MKNYLLLLGGSVICFLLFLTKGQAQFPAAWHYTTEDGLPSSMIYRCAEDKDGYLWFVTDRGVSRFDGYKFQRFTLSDGLTSNDVWGVETSADGRLWFSSFNDPIYFENEKFYTIKSADISEKPKKVQDFRFDSKGIGYFKHLSDQYQIRPAASGGFEMSKMPDNHFLTEDSSGHIWYYNLKIREHLKIGKEPMLTEPQFSIDLSAKTDYYSLNSPMELTTGILFSGRERYVWFDFNSVKIHRWEEVLPPGIHVIGVYKFKDDLLLIKSTKGYFVLDENLNILEGYEFFNEYNLNYALQDSRGNIWLCTRDDGVYFLTEAAFKSRTYQSQKEDLSDDILQLIFDNNGTLCAGTGDGDLFVFKNDKLIDYNIELPPALSNRIMGLEITTDGSLLIGGDFGFAGIEPAYAGSMSVKLNQSNQFFYDDIERNKLYNCYVKTIEQFNDNIYIGHRLGVSRFRVRGNNVMRHQLVEKESTPTYALSATENGLWIGKKEGLFYWSESEREVIFKGDEHSLFNYSVNALATDSVGNLWVGTDGFGVFRYAVSTNEIDEIPELKNSIAKSMFVDKEDEIWIAHNNGVSRLKVTNLTPFEYEHRLLDRAHGLPSNEVNDVIKKGNDIFVGTKDGLTILDYESVFSDENNARLHIADVKINGASKEKKASFSLSPNENNIAISFVCLSFKSNKAISYSYKMEGLDEEWQTTTDLKKEYIALPSGKYTFRIKARTSDGFSSDEKQISFQVGTFWWKTGVAYLFYFLVGSLLLRFFYLRRIRLIEAKNKEQNEINKKFAELELEALQAQMNPHFIFNAMQSIQNFILKKDERTANKYMVRFSRLMRLFLESSKKKYISVKEEIRLLKFYVELEHLRFPDKFDYSFDIAEGLEESSLEVASMMLQPFVENAINHGLLQSKKKGNLVIRISKSDGFLNIIIDDDGIGRAAAQKLREESFKHHKSRGMQLVEGRRKVLNRLNEFFISVKIIDKKNNLGEATGTRVVLELPLHQPEIVSEEK